jgi:hypothetical protein
LHSTPAYGGTPSLSYQTCFAFCAATMSSPAATETDVMGAFLGPSNVEGEGPNRWER